MIHPIRVASSRQCLEPIGLSVIRAAQKLSVSPEALLELINERAGLST